MHYVYIYMALFGAVLKSHTFDSSNAPVVQWSLTAQE